MQSQQQAFRTQENSITFTPIKLWLNPYEFNKYKTDNKKSIKKNVELYSKTLTSQTFRRENNFAAELSDAVKLARDVINEPPLFLTPSKLAEISETVAHEGTLDIEVFDKEQILKMAWGHFMQYRGGARSLLNSYTLHIHQIPNSQKRLQ